MNNIKVVVIRGNFNQDEFERLLELIRQMNTRPDAEFELAAADPATTSLESAERLLRQAVPQADKQHAAA